MKHKLSLTLILLAMFLITQFIGLGVIKAYSPTQQLIVNPETGQRENITLQQDLPYGMQPPEEIDAGPTLVSIIIAFIIAISIILILSKYKWKFLIRAWFFVVVALALGIAFNAFLKNYLVNAHLIVLAFAIPLAFIKIYRPNILIHNLTELLIYPGIAAVFVSILNIWTIIILLILISIYDMWAVWYSGIMQKMAKFQMKELKIFGGFLIPSISKKMREKIKKLKKLKKLKGKKIRISLAILGGGDVVFPIITAGVFFRAFGLIPALFIIAGAFLGLLFLFIKSEKKKFYPAMPFITLGILLGILVSYALNLLIVTT